jgi:hypothetical protein
MRIGTLAPRWLDLRELMADIPNATPSTVAKFLDVTERSVWRWLADNSAPRAALLALWYQTKQGQYEVAVHVGNEAMWNAGMARAQTERADAATARLARVLAISDTGAANDPFNDGPSSPPPSSLPNGLVVQPGITYRGGGRARNRHGVG